MVDDKVQRLLDTLTGSGPSHAISGQEFEALTRAAEGETMTPPGTFTAPASEARH